MTILRVVPQSAITFLRSRSGGNYATFFFIFLASACLISSTLKVEVLDARANSRSSFFLPLDDKDVAHLHESLLVPKPRSFASTAADTLTFHTTTTKVAGVTITRSIPFIKNIPVEGADGVFKNAPGISKFYYTHFTINNSSFALTAAEAFEIALGATPGSLIRDPYVEKIDGMFAPIWLVHFGALRPCYKIRPPKLSLNDLEDVYLDAQTGEVLAIEPTASFVTAPANAFVYSPTGEPLDSGLKRVLLKNLVSLEEDGFLTGEYIEVKNCCKYFTCPTEGPCTDATKRCARASHQNAQQIREVIELPTDSLGLDPLVTLPKTVTVDTVRCAYLPFARAAYQDKDSSVLGFFDRPIEQPGVESEIDRFAEIQAYFSISSFFNHARMLMDDKTFCLRKEAMSCNSDGTTVKDDNGYPINPFRVFVNQMIPDLKMSKEGQSDPESFLAQILGGFGSKNRPVKLNHFARYGNAAFVPALSTISASTPRADEILSDLLKPYDHNVFFQGERDFAYDGDVVFHEFMHAITTTLVGKLNTLGLSTWGIHSEPGSLNEGWSDYFAASFTESPAIGRYAAIQGGFGEIGIRNIDNNKRCPDDVIGEIHNDSQIWSGALWQIRSELTKKGGSEFALAFDRAVLASLALATKTEDFAVQSEKLIETLQENETLGATGARIAEDILTSRGAKNCARAFTLSRVNHKNQIQTVTKDLLFIPSKNQIGLKNYAPSSLQLEIEIPAGAQSLTLHWHQFLGATGALLGSEANPGSTDNIIPLTLLASLDKPLEWSFINAMAKAQVQEQTPLETEARFNSGSWSATLPLRYSRCDQGVLYASLLSHDYKYVLENISVSFDIDHTENRSRCVYQKKKRVQPSNASGCSQSSLAAAQGMGLVMLWRLRRKRRAF